MLSGSRIMRLLEELSRIGRDSSGGVTRLAYTEEETRAFEYVMKIGEEYGLLLREDPVGNLYLSTDPSEESTVLLGSHLDTVPSGGKFDGALGVICSLEIARALSKVKLERGVTVAVFRAEESARFGVSLIGSSIATGQFEESLLEARDRHGVKLFERRVVDRPGLT